MTGLAQGLRRNRSWLAPGAGMVAVVLIALWIADTGPRNDRSSWPSRFASNGERIYFTGTSVSESVIRASGGNPHMLMMGGGGCVSCHGTDREGGRLFPNPWVVAPAITVAALTGVHGENPDGHDEHAPYTAETLARVITTGLRPDGSAVATAMPRWEIAAPDLRDLVAYLLGKE